MLKLLDYRKSQYLNLNHCLFLVMLIDKYHVETDRHVRLRYFNSFFLQIILDNTDIVIPILNRHKSTHPSLTASGGPVYTRLNSLMFPGAISSLFADTLNGKLSLLVLLLNLIVHTPATEPVLHKFIVVVSENVYNTYLF